MAIQPKELAQELLDELANIPQEALLSEFKERTYLLKSDKAIQTNAAEGWMCKAIVYGLSNKFTQMQQCFLNSLQLRPYDSLTFQNYLTALSNYGRYEEVLDLIRQRDESYLGNISDAWANNLVRAAIGTLNLEFTTYANKEYAEKITDSLALVNLDINDARKLLLSFHQIMQKRGIRFGIIPSVSWSVDGDIIHVYYDVIEDADTVMEIMSEYDQLTLNDELAEISYKISICLIPKIEERRAAS